MPKAESEKPLLKIGQVVKVSKVSPDEDVLTTDEIVVKEAGQPKIVSQVDDVEVTTTELKIQPVQSEDVAQDAAQ